MKNTGTCLVALLGGMVIGSVVTMLFTPKSGEEMRGSIKDYMQREGDRLRNRYRDMKQQAEAEMEN